MSQLSSSSEFSRNAQWVWGEDDPRPYNAWRYFRRRADVPSSLRRATLLITADTTYECNVNGKHVGRGPVRGFQFSYPFDAYDVTSDLASGQANVIAVLVNALSDHTMNSIKSRPGFLAELVLELKDGQIHRISSDRSWKTAPCEMFNADAPRISIQLPFEEQVDARRENPLWRTLDFDDAGWSPACEIGPLGTPPWTELEARTIPFLTEDPVLPVEVKAVELARIRPGTFWSLDVRDLAMTDRTGLRSNPPGERGWLLFTEVTVAQNCSARVYLVPNYEPIDLRINDVIFTPDTLDGDDLPLEVSLQRGPNLVMIRNAQWPALLFECTEPHTFSAERFVAYAAWVFSGPFNELNRELAARWNAASLDDLPVSDRRVGIPATASKTDIYALTATQEFFAIEGGFCSHDIARATPRPWLAGERPLPVLDPAALLHDTAEWTVIQPQPDGDVHLVIDFGREIIGYVEIDLDASEGTIVDANLFEGIDDAGIFWTRNLRNTFRYVCREGRQTFTSHQRRGFRYGSFTFRNMRRPLKIRHVRTLLATYPVEQRGAFACSDETLNKIWQVAAYTVRLCMLDTYVDCPAYEQTFWVGDARNSALVNAVVFGAFDLTDHCVRLTGQSLSPALEDVRPPHLQRPHITASHVVSGWFDEIPMWTFLWVRMAWEQYWLTGDREALAHYFQDVRECLRRCAGFLTARDLLDIPDVWNIVDWAAQDLERHGEVISNTALMAWALDDAARMADTLGQPDVGSQQRQLAARLREAINRYGWSDDYQGYVDTVRDEPAYQRYRQRMERAGLAVTSFEDFRHKQRISEQTNTLVLLCGAVPAERYQAVMRFVLAAKEGQFVGSSPWMAYRGHPDSVVPVGSPWFLFFTLETLFQEHYADDALTILREQWNRMLEKGATTFWETFPGLVNRHWSRSLCHGWSAAPAYFLSTQVLGVTAASPGYERIRIAPESFHLSWARGTVPTPRGPVTVAWQKLPDGQLGIEYSVPPGCEVEVVLPG